jgi:polar amino acid transport system substrate-binding protein
VAQVKRALFLLLLAGLHLQAMAVPVPADQVLAICDDINEWPPYLYYQRDNSAKTNKLAGYAIDVLDEILGAHKIKYKVTLLPWARCLGSVSAGTHAMALNVVRNPARERSYLLTTTYYSVRNFYFYSRKHHPNGLPINGVEDIRKHQVCGILNYDHSSLGMKPGDIDQGSKTYDALISKLHLGRCTLFISQYEAMLGYALIGQSYFDDPDLGYSQIPGYRLAAFTMAVSRAVPYGAELRQILSQGISSMHANGRLDAIWKKHLPPIPQHVAPVANAHP